MRRNLPNLLNLYLRVGPKLNATRSKYNDSYYPTETNNKITGGKKCYNLQLFFNTTFCFFAVKTRHPSSVFHLPIVDSVVPSPADSFVLLATSCTSLAPMFWNLSFSSIPLATVTPSLVILGEPHDCSRITFRPCQQNPNIRTATNRILFFMEKTLGPIVTATASARTSTPCNINARTSAPNRTSLA